MEGTLQTVARILQQAARNPMVQETFRQLARYATYQLVKYVRQQTRRARGQGSWR